MELMDCLSRDVRAAVNVLRRSCSESSDGLSFGGAYAMSVKTGINVNLLVACQQSHFDQTEIKHIPAKDCDSLKVCARIVSSTVIWLIIVLCNPNILLTIHARV